MANHGTKQTEDSDIERTPEYVAFMRDLAAYHQQRGTHLQKEPALGPRRISLLKLYNKIIAYGGYDKVSDTSLMWRRIASEYNVPPMSNAGMPGYLLKSMYYKNLAAFEIERHWGKKAPPPELLEQLTARGGAILSRPEVANPLHVRNAQSPINQSKNARTQQTPRTTQTQHVAVHMVVPPMPPVTHTTEYFRPPPQSDYVRPLYPITAGQFSSISLHDTSTNHMQPLISRQFLDQHKPAPEPEFRVSTSTLFRASMSLRSGIKTETTWAIQLLTKASYEMADDFHVEKITGLAEVLLSELERGIAAMGLARSTSDSGLPRINGDASERAPKRVKMNLDRFQRTRPEAHSLALSVALILRNLTLQTENARYIARLPISMDILTAGLKLPEEGECFEMKQYCIELCDALVPLFQVSSEEDELYLALVSMLTSDDRNKLLLGLRGLSRLSVADEHNRLLQDISAGTISKLVRMMHLEDVELLQALIGFFFQYTTYQANTHAMARIDGLETLLQRLLGLTMWNAQEKVEQLQITDPRTVTKEIPQPPNNPPQLSDEIVRELLTFQEPERAIHWMRACFEEDREQSVTQILLWQSYRTLFTPFSQPQQTGPVAVSGRPLLQAADVIKMVGNAFNGATAMVVNHPTEGQKFIIRGIRCREYPLAPSGKKYATCQWSIGSADQTAPCAAPFATQKDLHAHIMEKHVTTVEGPKVCKWAGCSRFAPDGESDTRKVAIHLRLHTCNLFPAKQSFHTVRGTNISVRSQHTLQDEKGEPKGVALTAALTLRNILCTDSQVATSNQVWLHDLRRDLVSHLTLNPVIAAQTAEVLAAL